MRKYLTALTAVAAFSANAGSMGPVSVEQPLAAFISGEGGYTWSNLDGYNLAMSSGLSIRSHQKTNGGTGRVAVGLIKPISELFSISGEMGWGYYGSTRSVPRVYGPISDLSVNFQNSSSTHSKSTLDGFDLLAGVAYNQPNYDLFFKAGALIQNREIKESFNTFGLPDTTFRNSYFKDNSTQVLPELKVGGAYHLTQTLALTGSYSHAFGSHTKFNAVFNPTTNASQVHDNSKNPSLDTIMLGLQYRFA